MLVLEDFYFTLILFILRYARADVMPLGKLSLNLTGPAVKGFAPFLHQLITALSTQVGSVNGRTDYQELEGRECLEALLFLSIFCIFVSIFCSLTASLARWLRHPPQEWNIRGFDSHLHCGHVYGSSCTSNLQIGTPVAILLGAWHYRISTGTGWPGISIL